MSTRYSGPADPSTPCPNGQPTYTFPSGSIWCPSETCEPGGHFVKRIAFEPRPSRVVDGAIVEGRTPVRSTHKPKPVAVAKPKPKDEWADAHGATHDFVSTK